MGVERRKLLRVLGQTCTRLYESSTLKGLPVFMSLTYITNEPSPSYTGLVPASYVIFTEFILQYSIMLFSSQYKVQFH